MNRPSLAMLAPAALAAAGFGGAWLAPSAPAGFAQPAAPTTVPSAVIPWGDARPTVAKWGELRTYFCGETHGTTDLLTAIAVLKPGESIHPAHRHAEEEFLVLHEGTGQWHLGGKETPATQGDVLYAAPWVMHGLVNTGDTPLTFFVVKWNGKGVKAPPKPPGDDGK